MIKGGFFFTTIRTKSFSIITKSYYKAGMVKGSETWMEIHECILDRFCQDSGFETAVNIFSIVDPRSDVSGPTQDILFLL